MKNTFSLGRLERWFCCPEGNCTAPSRSAEEAAAAAAELAQQSKAGSPRILTQQTRCQECTLFSLRDEPSLPLAHPRCSVLPAVSSTDRSPSLRRGRRPDLRPFPRGMRRGRGEGTRPAVLVTATAHPCPALLQGRKEHVGQLLMCSRTQVFMYINTNNVHTVYSLCCKEKKDLFSCKL